MQHEGANMAEQATHTLRIDPVDDWEQMTLEDNMPALVQVLASVRETFGLTGTLLDMHFLRQASAAALFTWHIDDQDRTNTPVLLPVSRLDTTVVVSLGGGESAMAVAGAPHSFEYSDAVGAAAAFHSQSVHASVHAEPGVEKIVFFFGA